jgi:hypothetical protein
LALSEHVFGRWLFSHEDGGARVYQARDRPIAPSRRPRDGFDIEPDGRFRVYTPGAADASNARDGRWTATGMTIAVEYEDGEPGLKLEIVDAAPGILKVRRT